MVFQQEEVRYAQTQEELSAVSSALLPRNQVSSRLQRVSNVFSWPLACGFFVLNLTLNSTRMQGTALQVREGLPVVIEAIQTGPPLATASGLEGPTKVLLVYN